MAESTRPQRAVAADQAIRSGYEYALNFPLVRERSEIDQRIVVGGVDPALLSQLAPFGEELGAGLSGLDDATLEAIAGFLDHPAEATRRATGSARPNGNEE